MEVHGQTGDSNQEMNELLLGFQKVKLRDRILLSPYTKFLLPSIIVAIFLPITVYAIMISSYVTDSSFSVATCNIRPEYFVDCLPGQNASETNCNAVLCCWDSALSLCYHTVPSQHGYTPVGGVFREGSALTPRETRSPLGSLNIEEIYLDVNAVDSNHVAITISTSSQVSSRKRRNLDSILHRYNDPRDEDLAEEDEVTQTLLHFLPRDRTRRTVEIELDSASTLKAYVHYPEFSVTVARDDFTIDETSSIFSTARGPFLLTETYWEWTLYVTNGTLYGLNGLEVNGTTNAIYNNENGTITPAFIAISPTGQGAAYYVDYKGPLEVQVLNVSNLIILRGMALPDNLAIHVFAGPTPLEAVQQLTAALTSATSSPFNMPPAFNYGLHVCPNGILNSTEQTIVELNEAVESLASLLAPWDSHCIHEKLAPMLNEILTEEDLEFVETARNFLEEGGRSFSPHLSPMVLADAGTLDAELEDSALLLNNGSSPYLGIYQDVGVVYPDWSNTDVKTMATNYVIDYLNQTGLPGTLWIRDAWPKDELNASFRSDVDFSVFDYMPEEMEKAMNELTVPHNLSTASGESHHKTHNSYSLEFRTFIRPSIPTIEFLGPPGESGNTSWSGLRSAVYSAVGAGLVGQLPAPIYVCGTGDFVAEIHDELCIRWYQAAVAWPYVVVLPDRIPGGSALSGSASLNIARALRLRASLATYQHTVTAGYFIRGSPVLAPTSVHYPEEKSVTFKWDQFMWGEALLIGLVTLPSVSQVPIQLPGNISWRHLMGGAEVIPVVNETTPVTASVGQLVTLVRPGYVVPIHKDVGNTTVETMTTNLTLAVNLDCEESSGCSALGEIYYGSESGEFLTIEINATHLILGNVDGAKSYSCQINSTAQATFIETVELLGSTSHQVDTELCDLEANNVTISLA